MPLNMVSMAIYVTLEGKIPRTPPGLICGVGRKIRLSRLARCVHRKGLGRALPQDRQVLGRRHAGERDPQARNQRHDHWQPCGLGFRCGRVVRDGQGRQRPFRQQPLVGRRLGLGAVQGRRPRQECRRQLRSRLHGLPCAGGQDRPRIHPGLSDTDPALTCCRVTLRAGWHLRPARATLSGSAPCRHSTPF